MTKIVSDCDLVIPRYPRKSILPSQVHFSYLAIFYVLQITTSRDGPFTGGHMIFLTVRRGMSWFHQGYICLYFAVIKEH